MTLREARGRLERILAAIAQVERDTKGMDIAAFSSDEETLKMVARTLSAIGEAAEDVPAELKAKYPDAPWGNLQGLREMVSQQAQVDPEVLWRHVQTTLPPMAPVLKQILEAER